MCDHQWSPWTESDSGQVGDSSVNSSKKKKCICHYCCALQIHELSVLHAEECAAMSKNYVKRSANQNCINCLCDVTGQSDMLSFLPIKVYYAQSTKDC